MKKILTILLIIVVMFTLTSCLSNNTVVEDLNSLNNETTPFISENIIPSINTPQSTPSITTTPVLPSDSYFQVHYIDVGQADSALIICDGKAMLIGSVKWPMKKGNESNPWQVAAKMLQRRSRGWVLGIK